MVHDSDCDMQEPGASKHLRQLHVTPQAFESLSVLFDGARMVRDWRRFWSSM